MLNTFKNILIVAIVLFITFKAEGQIAMPDNVCVGAEKHYWVDSIIGSGSTYTWKIDNVIQQKGAANLFSIIWKTTGAFLLEVQETSASNCSGEVKSDWVYVHPFPIAPTIVLTQPNCVLATGTITVSSPLGKGITYSIGDYYQQSATFSALASGKYTVTQKDSNGFISEGKIVTINTLPLSPAAIVGEDRVICLNEITQIGSIAVAGNTYSWNSFPVGLIFTTANPTLTALETTIYTLIETITETGCQNSNSVVVTVNSAPKIITEPVDQTTSEGSSVSFSILATGTDLTYQWRNGKVNLTDGGNISGATTAMLTINPVDISNIASNYNVVISGSCSPDNTSKYVSLDYKNIESIVTIYPNPFSTSIEIFINDASLINSYKFRIYNLLGQDMINIYITKQETILETSILPSGTYYYQAIGDNNNIQSGKLISQQ